MYANTVEEAINDRVLHKRELSGSAIVGQDGTDDEMSDILRALQMSPMIGVKNE